MIESMMNHINPYELNISGTIQRRIIDKSNGQVKNIWADEYSNVFMKRLPPPRGREIQQGKQPVAVQIDSFLIVDEDRSPTITAADFRIVIEGENYYITGVRPFKSEMIYMVLDTEKKDNE